MEQDVTLDETDPGIAVIVWALLSAARDRLPPSWRPWIPWAAVVLAAALRALLDATARGTVDASTLLRAAGSGAVAVLGQAASRAPAKARAAVRARDDSDGR
jgi:hypothetical protein